MVLSRAAADRFAHRVISRGRSVSRIVRPGHATVMHLLQAGIDIATIALWLGHESIETTHLYLQADLARQKQALEKLDLIERVWKRFQADDPLLTFLNSL